MNRINSQDLWEFVNGLGTKEKVKFKVYHDDVYVTEILWNGDMFEWEEGTITSEAFFNPLYDFVEIEDNEKIEELDKLTPFEAPFLKNGDVDIRFSLLIDQQNYMIDHINELEGKLNGE